MIKEKTINELLNMNYTDVVNYLKQKYGSVPKNYFTPSGNKTAGISRGKDGLYIHHIDEDKMILLSNKIGEHPVVNEGLLTKEQIKLVENDFQQKDRLVYCDLLEHLLLHLIIMEEPKPLIKSIEVGKGGIISFFVPELNDIFSGIQYKQEWKQAVVKKVIDRKEPIKDFFILLEYGINKQFFKREDLISSLPLNQMIWDSKNNFKLFNAFDGYLAYKSLMADLKKRNSKN